MNNVGIKCTMDYSIEFTNCESGFLSFGKWFGEIFVCWGRGFPVSIVSMWEGIGKVECYLVRKILSQKKANRDGFKAVFEQIWNVVKRLEIKAIGENIFVFHFSHLEVREMASGALRLVGPATVSFELGADKEHKGRDDVPEDKNTIVDTINKSDVIEMVELETGKVLKEAGDRSTNSNEKGVLSNSLERMGLVTFRRGSTASLGIVTGWRFSPTIGSSTWVLISKDLEELFVRSYELESKAKLRILRMSWKGYWQKRRFTRNNGLERIGFYQGIEIQSSSTLKLHPGRKKNTILRNFVKEDVKIAILEMRPTKALRPDGFQAVFFQKFWHIVGDDVIKVCLSVLSGDLSIRVFNQTNIVLIPKKKNPLEMKDFRPISLCFVVYKIVTKCLANRLKLVLPNIIDPCQNVFVPGRLIFDNVLVAFEMLHCINKRKKGKKGLAAIKLDMSKTYDRAEWSLLGCVMEKLGFPHKWTSLVFECISSSCLCLRIMGKWTSNGGGKKQNEDFQSNQGEGLEKIKSWKGGLFSMGGKDVLFKAVAQSIPSYLISTFQLPLCLCKELTP
ncbi:hypothetical protein Dsin_008587 [Dipteronia sinensis]|uniref:Reverse transcriptase domain-containing protein n=1 Tax=Dipteronia sinensis TaxID=43782 RepID=A0AAE0AQ72_9ROSI|nr:hypothetical protein Dsin_008587 [Dipteronia sinensis]